MKYTTFNDSKLEKRLKAKEVLHKLGYRWSNEAQVYYSTDFSMATLTPSQAGHLVKSIWYVDPNFGLNKDE